MAIDLGLMVGFGDADGNHVTVPAPSTDPGAVWLADWVRDRAAWIGATFDAAQWPPTSKAQGGAGAGCDGYGVFDRYDLGTKPQQGSVPTRWGTLESLLAAVAALAAHGVASFGDLPLHQVIGENGGPGVFRYLGADGKTLNGRGAIDPGMLRGGLTGDDPIPPFCKEDDVPQPDTAFGREISYQHCDRVHETADMAIDWTDWLERRVGFTGFRWDDAKGMWAGAVGDILSQFHLAGSKLQFNAEYFDGSEAIHSWVTSPRINGMAGVEDFPLHFAIQRACNGYDATQLDSAGYWQRRPDLAVGFVENRDTDLGAGMAVVANKLLGYAYGLMLPCRRFRVYAKDLIGPETWPGAYGLGAPLENLIWIARMFAYGKYAVRWVDRDVHVSTRDGDGGAVGYSGGLLTAINFNPNTSRTITCGTPFGPDRQLHDYTGGHGDVWTSGDGSATFTIPANTGSAARSALCFAPGGADYVDRAITLPGRSVTQTFFGAADLDVMPVRNGMQTLPQRLWIAQGKVSFSFVLNRAGVSVEAGVQLEFVAADGHMQAWAATGISGSVAATAWFAGSGWHTIRLVGNLLPETGAPFQLRVTYRGGE